MLLQKIHQEPEGPFLGILNRCEFLIALVLAFGPLNQLQHWKLSPAPTPIIFDFVQGSDSQYLGSM